MKKCVTRKSIGWLLLLMVLSGCSTLDAPYFGDPPDPYVTGMRWFNRKDYKWAKKYWEPLAEEGDCDAQFRMGTLCFLGAGVPQDYDAARQWWLHAAAQGQSFAQALLATMYARDSMSIMTISTETTFDCTGGCRCEKNMLQAYKWMKLSEKCAVYDDTRRAAALSAKE